MLCGGKRYLMEGIRGTVPQKCLPLSFLGIWLAAVIIYLDYIMNLVGAVIAALILGQLEILSLECFCISIHLSQKNHKRCRAGNATACKAEIGLIITLLVDMHIARGLEKHRGEMSRFRNVSDTSTQSQE